MQDPLAIDFESLPTDDAFPDDDPEWLVARNLIQDSPPDVIHLLRRTEEGVVLSKADASESGQRLILTFPAAASVTVFPFFWMDGCVRSICVGGLCHPRSSADTSAAAAAPETRQLSPFHRLTLTHGTRHVCLDSAEFAAEAHAAPVDAQSGDDYEKESYSPWI